MSEGAVGEQEDISEFEAAFNALPDEVSLRNLEPKMSTVAYKTTATSWDPQAVLDLYDEEQMLTLPIAVNQEARVAWFVTEMRTPVRWGDLRTVEEVTFDLYVLYWDEARQLLYINSSNNKSTHETLAKAVCGDSAERITGEQVYRVMAQVHRLVPTNVGLLDIYKRSRRFSMHVGADVTEGFPPAACTPASDCSSSCAASSSASARRARATSSSPACVIATLRVVRSTSASPTSASRLRICCDSAGCATCCGPPRA